MLLGTKFTKFVEESPASVMVQGTLERIFDPDKLEAIFQENAVRQYTKELTFAQCIYIMSDVVFQVSPSVGAFLQDHPDEISVARQSVYEKLRNMELPISMALVRDSTEPLLSALGKMKAKRPPLLPGYRVRVLDGNHLAGTEHRIFELRRYRAAALPGQALVFYDPRFDVCTDVFPCEDAYSQERSLLHQVLAAIVARDCIVADRNFCTTSFLFGIARRKAFFVIRQHASTLHWELQGRRRRIGKDRQGRWIHEQSIHLTDPETGETLVARRITIPLATQTRNGDTEIHVLTNLPVEVGAVKIAELYADRWTIETAFQHLTEDLRCEINTLGYPRAALFGFCVALLAYNVVSVVKGAMRAALGKQFVEEELSMYYLTLEISRVTSGMLIATGDQPWRIFGTMSIEEYAETMVELAGRMDSRKYTKHKRGPKKKPPKKISGKRNHHVSTARILATRR